ncbi:hypothetical protein KIN20_025537 [Parelaphostrongylus tenuis]|uniref:Uncharacterized protein n=1 Tax=Parelaphostrongylus tenuis TaxID=148309 RepID=A0AAD5MVG2_PARTN|nr:hypothetical protein KIN20_025537 [Parelaphostrongylus tenuis]
MKLFTEEFCMPTSWISTLLRLIDKSKGLEFYAAEPLCCQIDPLYTNRLDATATTINEEQLLRTLLSNHGDCV